MARREERRLEEGRRAADLWAGGDHQLRVVAGFEVARLCDGQRVAHHDGLRPFNRAGQILPGQRWPERRARSGLRQERQVPVLPRVHGRRSGERLVRPVECRHARNLRHLPRRAAKRSGLAARAGKRRGKAGGSGQAGFGEAASRRSRGQERPGKTGRSDAGRQVAAENGPAVPHRHRRAGIPHPRPSDSGGRPVEPAGGYSRPDLLLEDGRRQRGASERCRVRVSRPVVAQPLRPHHAQERHAPSRGLRLRRLR